MPCLKSIDVSLGAGSNVMSCHSPYKAETLFSHLPSLSIQHLPYLSLYPLIDTPYLDPLAMMIEVMFNIDQQSNWGTSRLTSGLPHPFSMNAIDWENTSQNSTLIVPNSFYWIS